MPTKFEIKANALIDNMQHLFVSIEPREFVTIDNNQKPNYDAIGDAYNQLNYAAQDDILASKSSEESKSAIEKWAKKMEKCWKDGNHIAAQAIYSALTAPTIAKLQANEKISSRTKKRLERFKIIF